MKGLISGIPAIFDVGKNIVEGLWNGIKSMGSWVSGKVKDFFGGIVGGVKDFLGIHSPSKVFAGIGGFMAEGLGEGFDDQFKSVKRTLKTALTLTLAQLPQMRTSAGTIQVVLTERQAQAVAAIPAKL